MASRPIARIPTGVYFGTRSGKLFGSNDAGASWRSLLEALPPVVCVKTAHAVITIQITGFLTDFTRGERTIVLDGSPQRSLTPSRCCGPGTSACAIGSSRSAGQVRPHVGIFVNTDNVRHRQGLDTAVAPGDEITILPAISGG